MHSVTDRRTDGQTEKAGQEKIYLIIKNTDSLFAELFCSVIYT